MQGSLREGRPALSAFLESGDIWSEELPHHQCHCKHCVNNTKPIAKPVAPRVVKSQEQSMPYPLSFTFVLKRLAKHNYSGRLLVPDVFLVEEGTLIFSSRSDRVRAKDSQNNMDVKKHFDDQRRRQVTSGLLATAIGSLATSGEEGGVASSKQAKEIALLTYRDGTSQLMSEALTNKVFEKRKNDPFWDDIAFMALLPPEAPQPLQKVSHLYQRTADTLLELAPLLEQLGEDMDRQEEKAFVAGRSPGASREGRDEELLECNPELARMNSLRLRKKDTAVSSWGQPWSQRGVGDPEDEARRASLELVAFIELCCHVRILSGQFEFVVDRKCVLVGVREMVWYGIEGVEVTLTHQRYQPMEEVEGEAVAEMKERLDESEERELSRICVGVVNECLERRRAELKLYDYVKPSEATMFQIFMKIFPDYKPEAFFSNGNWKNELPSFVGRHKARIHAVIREDEGIRILRRFGIHFRRTFK